MRIVRIAFGWSMLLPLCAVAQVVEMEVPSTENLMRGILSVVFRDTVAEEQARLVVTEFGYDVARSNYRPITVAFESPDPVSDVIDARLRDHPAFIEIMHIDRRRLFEQALQRFLQGDSARTHGAFDTIRFGRVNTWAIFKSSISEADLHKHLQAIDGIERVQIMKSPNELYITVPIGREEEARERLQGHPLVELVSYVVAQEHPDEYRRR